MRSIISGDCKRTLFLHGFGVIFLLTENPFINEPENDCADKLKYNGA